MNWQETIAVVGLFALRVVIPLLITLGIGELLSRRYAARQQPTLLETGQAARGGYELSPHCWEIRNCDLAIREVCPAYLRPQVPCWLALQVAGQDLPEECFSCEVYHRAQSVTAVDTAAEVRGG